MAEARSLHLKDETLAVDGLGHLVRGLATIPNSITSLNVLGWRFTKGNPYFAGENIGSSGDEDSEDQMISDATSDEEIANLNELIYEETKSDITV